jgi:tetratricopeptide (TPR) repeat protein
MSAAAAGELGPEFLKTYRLKPYGLVLKIIPEKKDYNPGRVKKTIVSKYRMRGSYESSRYKDYFSKDFIRQYAEMYDRLGLEFFKIGDIDKARDMYENASRLDRDLAIPYSNLAYTYYSEGKMTEALESYSKAASVLEKEMPKYTRNKKIKEDLSEVFNNMGVVYEKLLQQTADGKNFDFARRSYNNSLKYDPANSQTYYNLGVLYWHKKDWQKVIENFELALKYDPENERIVSYLKKAIHNLRTK